VASCADVPTGYASSGIGLNVATGRNPSDPSAAVDAYNGRCALSSGADSLAPRAVPEATTAGSGGRNLFTVLRQLRQDWLGNIRNDLLAGLVVALALIPEAIAFSIIAGVDPKVGLYASFCIAVVIAFAGGRPGMISAATGAMALVMVTLVKEHGLQYLLAASVLTGVLQIVAGLINLGSLMRFVSRSVVTGFVNALAILIFMAQLPELIDVTWHVYAMTAAGLAIIYGLPLLTRAVPSPLVTIVVLSAVAITLDLDIRRVGDMGELPDSLPVFLYRTCP
jgi:SulP family sulfate permease